MTDEATRWLLKKGFRCQVSGVSPGAGRMNDRSSPVGNSIITSVECRSTNVEWRNSID